MIVPAGVNFDKQSDEEIVAAYVAAGLSEEYARAILGAVRAPSDPDRPLI